MSLIPSESYSFPDHFTSTVVPLRRPKQEKPEPPIEQARRKPAIVALPDPEPEAIVVPENGNGELEIEPVKAPVAPVPLAPPNPALRRVHAPPPRIPETSSVKRIQLPVTLKPKPRWNNRAPAMDPTAVRNNNGNGTSEVLPPSPPAQNVIPMRAAKPTRPPQIASPPPAIMQPAVQSLPAPKVMPVQQKTYPVQAPLAPRPKPRPAPVWNPQQADFFEMFEENGQAAAAQHRRQMKLRRFIACESAALLVLLPLVILGLTLNITAPALRWLMNIFTIAAAVAAAVIPIVFYAFTPTLPELER